MGTYQTPSVHHATPANEEDTLKAKDDKSIFPTYTSATYTSNLAEMIRDNQGWALCPLPHGQLWLLG